MEKVRFDKETEEWFKHRPGMVTTLVKCEKCGLFYKASLGHKCEVERSK